MNFNDDFDDNLMESKQEGKGSFVNGVLVGALAVLLCFLTTLAILIKVDILTINKDSSIVGGNVSSLASKIDAKLSIIDNRISDFYFESPDENVIVDNICKAYLDSFNDKYTVYYTKEQFKKLQESNNGAFVGIGVLVGKLQDGRVEFLSVYKDSPADKAGIKDGDCLISVDGKSVIDETMDETVARVRGEKGSQVVIVVERGDEKIEATLTRDVVDYETVGSMELEDDIYYIQISQFVGTTPEHFKRDYDQCIANGAKGIIIDVRENPGGNKEDVLQILDMLCPKGLLMYTESKDGKRIDDYGKSDSEATIPMVVLVNGNSASAAEVFSGDLQDYGKATIVGTQTYGKGIVQTIKSLGDGTAVKYTTSKYYTAKGQDIHGHGVTPDVVVEYVEPNLPEGAEYTYRDDNQVVKAIDILKEKIGK